MALSERAFSVGGPNVWNSLSLETRKAEDFAKFKKLLKSEFFRIYMTKDLSSAVYE